MPLAAGRAPPAGLCAPVASAAGRLRAAPAHCTSHAASHRCTLRLAPLAAPLAQLATAGWRARPAAPTTPGRQRATVVRAAKAAAPAAVAAAQQLAWFTATGVPLVETLRVLTLQQAAVRCAVLVIATAVGVAFGNKLLDLAGAQVGVACLHRISFAAGQSRAGQWQEEGMPSVCRRSTVGAAHLLPAASPPASSALLRPSPFLALANRWSRWPSARGGPAACRC